VKGSKGKRYINGFGRSERVGGKRGKGSTCDIKHSQQKGKKIKKRRRRENFYKKKTHKKLRCRGMELSGSLRKKAGKGNDGGKNLTEVMYDFSQQRKRRGGGGCETVIKK